MRGTSTSTPPFLVKTYMLVEDPVTDGVISWNDDGAAFVVWQPTEFARDLLPTVFKHSNFSSFIRQLNTYGFRKVATNRWEFSNDMFRKGERDRLCKIRRRKSTSNKPQPNVQVPAADNEELSTSSSSELSGLMDENRRLKRENGALNSELTIMKKKCEELLNLVAVYGEHPEKEEQSFEMEEDNKGDLKLFGVRMEVGGERERRRGRGRG